MNSTLKKALIIAGVVVDVGITIFLFVISIIMLATLPENLAVAVTLNGEFIGYLQQHSTFYLLVFVLPLFLLLALNIGVLVWYVKKAGQKKAVEMGDLDEAQKEALKAELLKDLSSGSSEDK